MKKANLILAVLFIVSFCGTAQGMDVWRYTFWGNVTAIYDPGNLLPTQTQFPPGFGVGSPVSYTFIVDYDAQAITIEYDGDVTIWPFTSTSGSWTYRYAFFHSGDIARMINVGYYGNPSSGGYNPDRTAQYNMQRFYYHPNPYGIDQFILTGGSDDEYITIKVSAVMSSPSSLIEGMTGFTGETIAYDNNGNQLKISFGATLNDINVSGADIDSSGYVDNVDFAILSSQWQGAPGVPSADIAPEGGDGIVDIQDLKALVEYWLWPYHL